MLWGDDHGGLVCRGVMCVWGILLQHGYILVVVNILGVVNKLGGVWCTGV